MNAVSAVHWLNHANYFNVISIFTGFLNIQESSFFSIVLGVWWYEISVLDCVVHYLVDLGFQVFEIGFGFLVLQLRIANIENPCQENVA